MCGIVGYVALDDKKYPVARQHFLRHAVSMGTLRGEDSTGIVSVYGKKFDVRTARSLQPGDKYVHSKAWDKISRDGWCTFGHNRAATVGDIKIGNAHPFRDGPITLVHNGTLDHKGASLPSYTKGLEVDSMQIARALHVASPEDAYKVLEYLEGAFALVWTDERDNSINMARNAQRPMHFTFNRTKTFLMFMSDGHMLTSINKSLWRSDAQGEAIYELDTLKHLKWKRGDLVPDVETFRPFVRPLPNRPPANTPAATPTAKKTEGSGASNATDLKTAVEKSRDKWMNRKPSGVSSDSSKNHIRHRLGKDSKPLVAALKKLYSVTNTQMMRFTPEEEFELKKNVLMLYGTIYIEEWGNTPWPAVIYDVPAVQAHAYAARDWKVRPVGITNPIDASFGDSPAILCDLVHCDWAGYKDQPDQRKVCEGPDGRLVGIKSLDRMIENGCVGCGCNLSMHEIDTYAYGNSRQDLICEDCKWDKM